MRHTQESRSARKPMGKAFFWAAMLCALIAAAAVYWWIVHPNGKSAPPSRLVVGTSSSVSTGLLSVAEENGFFEAEGIPVEIRRYRSAGLALKEMLAGKIGIAGVSETPLVRAGFSRADFRIVAVACTSSSDPKIVVRRDSGIDVPSDLAGRRIGSTRKGQSAHFFLYLFLLKHRIPENAVAVIHDAPGAVVERLASGDLQAAALFEPYAYRAAKRLGRNGRVFEEVGLYHKTFCLAVHPRLIDNNVGAIGKFLRALIRAENYYQNHPESAAAMIASDLGVHPDIVEFFMQNATLTVELHSSLPAALKDQGAWMVENGLIDSASPPDFDRLIEPGPLRAIDSGRVGAAFGGRPSP